MNISVGWILDFVEWIDMRIESFAQQTEIWLGLRDPGGNWIPKKLR